jgi:hypothetical protein
MRYRKERGHELQDDELIHKHEQEEANGVRGALAMDNLKSLSGVFGNPNHP